MIGRREAALRLVEKCALDLQDLCEAKDAAKYIAGGGEGMKFDRDGIWGGITVYSQLENGKAQLEITVNICFEEQASGLGNRTEGDHVVTEKTISGDVVLGGQSLAGVCRMVEFRILDGRKQEIGSACIPAESVCSVKTMLIHPHVWQSTDDPYVYTICAVLLQNGVIQDQIKIIHGIRSFKNLPIKGYCLNQKPFWLQAVRFTPVFNGGKLDEKVFGEEILILKELGVNTLCMKEHCDSILFYQMCDEAGFVVWKETEQEKTDSRSEVPVKIPCWSGPDGIWDRERSIKRDNFYYYKACWSKDAFIYVCGHEDFQKNTDTIAVCVYSNQKKAALYIDGILFEFKESMPLFLFEDVPLREDTIITAQAGDYTYSVTWKKNPCLS